MEIKGEKKELELKNEMNEIQHQRELQDHILGNKQLKTQIKKLEFELERMETLSQRTDDA